MDNLTPQEIEIIKSGVKAVRDLYYFFTFIGALFVLSILFSVITAAKQLYTLNQRNKKGNKPNVKDHKTSKNIN